MTRDIDEVVPSASAAAPSVEGHADAPKSAGDAAVSACEGSASSPESTFLSRAFDGVVKAIDYVGESVADLIGLTTPRYQYVIDAYQRHLDEVAEEEQQISRGIERMRERELDEERSRRHGEDADPDEAAAAQSAVDSRVGERV
ncbi:FAM177 family [Plasmodiophora brassicae]